MKIKLTEKWKQSPHSRSSSAIWNDISLGCVDNSSIHLAWPHTTIKFIGMVEILGLPAGTRYGKNRKSVALARRDAERLAMKLQQDLIDGARKLSEKYCGEEM